MAEITQDDIDALAHEARMLAPNGKLSATSQSRLRKAGRGATIATATASVVIGGPPCECRPCCRRSDRP